MGRKKAPDWSRDICRKDGYQEECNAIRQATRDLETRFRQIAAKRKWAIHTYN